MENFDFQLKRGFKTREISTWMFFFLATFHLGSSSQIHDEKKNDFFFVFGQRNFYSTQEVILKKKHFLKKTNAQRLPNNEL